jgi:hypothetical protein
LGLWFTIDPGDIDDIDQHGEVNRHEGDAEPQGQRCEKVDAFGHSYLVYSGAKIGEKSNRGCEKTALGVKKEYLWCEKKRIFSHYPWFFPYFYVFLSHDYDR